MFPKCYFVKIFCENIFNSSVNLALKRDIPCEKGHVEGDKPVNAVMLNDNVKSHKSHKGMLLEPIPVIKRLICGFERSV